MPEEASDQHKQLIDHFGALLKELSPSVEAKADKAGLSVTLHFDSTQLERPEMRRLAVLVADAAV